MSTGITSLDSSLSNTAEWFNDIEEELKWPDKNRIYSATKAVLNTLRDCLTIEELHHFTAQIPMIWTGMLFDGYVPTGKPLRLNRQEFLQSVRDNFGPNPLNAEEATIAIAKVLKKRISKGQYEDIVGQLQDDVKTLFK
jgi:uncharacterized protein (DUF2267 family)